MSDDLIARLRRWAHDVNAVPASDLMDEAADAIEIERRWISVTDRLPELHEHVIGWQHGWARTAEVWRGSKGQWLGGDFEPAGDVTHWMPLPEPPQ